MTETYQHHLPIGAILGEYKIEKILGEGGFGVTYLVIDQNLSKQFAIKEYLPSDMAIRSADASVQPKSESSKEDFFWGLERFLDEARTLATFQHPNLNQVQRFFEANGTAYMVLEYVPGETLSQRLKHQPILPETELQNIINQLLSGLAVVHQANYTHRDIKPANIMIQPDGTPVLLDFGAARQALGYKSKSITAILTPGYAPIEQYDTKAADIGPWTDLYSLGMVAYCCISGKKTKDLIESPSRASIVRKGKVDQDLPKAVSLAQGKYDESLLQAIDWAMQVYEEDRPQSVADMQRAFLEEPAPLPVKKVEKTKKIASPTKITKEESTLAEELYVKTWQENKMPPSGKVKIVGMAIMFVIIPWFMSGGMYIPTVEYLTMYGYSTFFGHWDWPWTSKNTVNIYIIMITVLSISLFSSYRLFSSVFTHRGGGEENKFSFVKFIFNFIMPSLLEFLKIGSVWKNHNSAKFSSNAKILIISVWGLVAVSVYRNFGLNILGVFIPSFHGPMSIIDPMKILANIAMLALFITILNPLTKGYKDCPIFEDNFLLRTIMAVFVSGFFSEIARMGIIGSLVGVNIANASGDSQAILASTSVVTSSLFDGYLSYSGYFFHLISVIVLFLYLPKSKIAYLFYNDAVVRFLGWKND